MSWLVVRHSSSILSTRLWITGIIVTIKQRQEFRIRLQRRARRKAEKKVDAAEAERHQTMVRCALYLRSFTWRHVRWYLVRRCRQIIDNSVLRHTASLYGDLYSLAHITDRVIVVYIAVLRTECIVTLSAAWRRQFCRHCAPKLTTTICPASIALQ